MEQYQAWAEKVQKKLQDNTDWVGTYEKYAEGIIENEEKMKRYRRKFHVPKPLGCYLTFGNSVDGTMKYDLRYLGQSVGEIHIKDDKDANPILVVTDEKVESSNKSFGFDDNDDEKIGAIYPKDKESWSNGEKAKAFRAFYENSVDKEKLPRQKEHMVEAKLFQELAKPLGKDKQLTQIQPIKFGGCFTHMKTAVKASQSNVGKVDVVIPGGEIDVFCRRKVSPKESRLTVIEVKDKPERHESFEEAMFQAISYAVFIRELIHTSYGDKWMQIWGINSKCTDGITINAVVAIPIDNETVPDFHGQKIVLGNDRIELHYMALKKDVLKGEGAVYFETKL